MNKVKFSSVQLEYGDTNLVDGGLGAAGWSWAGEFILDQNGDHVRWVSPRGGLAPERGKEQLLKHATRAISHGDYFQGWFRPDFFGHHYQLLLPHLPPCERVSELGAGTYTLKFGDQLWSARHKPEHTDVPRLLHLHAICHGTP